MVAAELENRGKISDVTPIVPVQLSKTIDRFSKSRRLTPMAAQRHSQQVRTLRLVIPALAAGLVATYAFNATPPRIDPSFVREFQQIEASDGALRLDRPRYVGEDEKGLAFEVSAQAAEQNPDSPDLIALENPEALRSVKSNGTLEPVKVRALAGTLDTENNHIALNEDVQLEHGFGGDAFLLKTEAADVDLEANTVTSNVGVTGEGERGTVAADTLTAYQEEGRLVLEGNVKLRLNPAPEKTENKSPLR